MVNDETRYPYIAIIGDIKDSRKLKQRETSQIRFTEALDQLNQTYQKDLAAKFTISMGDSFQGLLKNKNPLINMLFELELNLAPIELRMGVGLGDVETEIDPDNSLLNDGTCYHRARAMIELTEQNEKQYGQSRSNILLAMDGEDAYYEELINTVFALETALKTKWTKRQKEIIRTYLANEKNQYKTAKALDIGQSSVNKALKSADFYTFNHSLSTIQDVINQL
ncbi:MAG: SatD family protein [Tetragenococcus sp.]|nr:SatD family protein [Tetragenococcus sp.]